MIHDAVGIHSVHPRNPSKQKRSLSLSLRPNLLLPSFPVCPNLLISRVSVYAIKPSKALHPIHKTLIEIPHLATTISPHFSHIFPKSSFPVSAAIRLSEIAEVAAAQHSWPRPNLEKRTLTLTPSRAPTKSFDLVIVC